MLGPKKIQYILVKYGSTKILGPNKFLLQKFQVEFKISKSKKILGGKKCWFKKCWVPKDLGRKNIESKKIGSKKVLANKKINLIKAIRIKQQSLEEHFFPLLLFVVGCGSVVLWRMRLAAAPYLLLIQMTLDVSQINL